MTNPHNQDRIAPIAGEPATAQPYKNIPPLTENHVNISDGFESGEQNTDKNKKSRKKFYAFLQVIIIVLALGLSTYSILLTESNDVNKGSLSNEGNEVLVRTEGREADHICTEGGADIFIGNDRNKNGILEESEVTSTTRLCHGKEGLSGPQGATGPNGFSGVNSIIDTEEVELGNLTCYYGGLLIKSGLDNNSNNVLDVEEIIDEEFLCNGQIGSDGINGTKGAPALVEKSNPPAYLCSNGVILKFGVDDGTGQATAMDGILQPDEVRDNLKICSQPLNSGLISDFSLGITNGMNTACASMNWLESKSMLISAGSDGINGCELWTSMATLSSTSLLIDINPTGDSTPGLWLGMHELINNGNELVFFDADDGLNGREMWVSDGTTSGTQRITSTNGVNDGLKISSKISPWMNGMVFTNFENKFMWSDGSTAVELFDAPFFSTSMQIILDSSTSDMSVHTLTELWPSETGMWFSAATVTEDLEIHHISNSGVLTSWNLNTLEGSMPSSLITNGADNIVIAEDGNNGRQLARLNWDGTHNWVTSLTLQNNGASATNVGVRMGLNLIGDILVFDAQTSGVDTTLWGFNITTNSAQELSNLILAPGENSGAVYLDGKIWFDCVTATSATELCYSDGTIAGSKLAHEFQPGISSSDIREIVVVNHQLLIIADGEEDGIDSGHCLWVLNSQTLEASIAYDPWSGTGNNSQSGTYGELEVSNEILFFIANNGFNGHEIHSWSPLGLTGDWLIWD
jgi:ELWxxDGT repeat protein